MVVEPDRADPDRGWAGGPTDEGSTVHSDAGGASHDDIALDDGGYARVVGDTVWLFRTRTAMRGWDRWLGEIGIDRIALTATGS